MDRLLKTDNQQNALTITSKEQLLPRALSEIVRERGIATPTQTIGCGIMSVARAVKLYSRKETAALIVAQIVRLQAMLNTARPLASEAIAETAYMVVDACLADDVELNFADIEIIFKRAASGQYGKIFGGFGSGEVLSWFNSYFGEKAEAFVDYREREASQYRYHSERTDRKEAERIAHHAAAVHYQLQKTQEK